jgi:hypothetical protein
MDEAALLETLRRIEARHAGVMTDGEGTRGAAERIKARLAEQRAKEPEVARQYSLPDPWEQRLFVALCRRYGLQPFRRPRQRATTVMVRAPETFLGRTLWPEFTALADAFSRHLRELAERVIREAIHDDAREAEELAEPRKLPGL